MSAVRLTDFLQHFDTTGHVTGMASAVRSVTLNLNNFSEVTK